MNNSKDMSLLIVGKINSTVIQQLGNQLKDYIEVYLFDITNFKFLKFENENKIIYQFNNSKSRLLPFLFFQRIIFALKIISKIKKLYHFNFIHYHYSKYEYLILHHFINKLGDNIFITIWGTNILKRKLTKPFFTNYFNKAKSITFTKKTNLDSFYKKYRIETKYSLIDLGLEQLDYIDKISNMNILNFSKKYNIQQDEICIAIGSCRDANENQSSIIQHLIKNVKLFSKYKLHIILPLTYGPNINKKLNLLANQLKNYMKVTLITEFLSYEELACLRVLSNIFINNKKKDQFSGGMCEHFYAGSIVMIGSWLDYPLDDMGAFYESFSNEEEFINKLLSVLNNYNHNKEKCKINKEIFGVQRWDILINLWLELYNV